MAKLYIVSTPIGNRKDISLRALGVLASIDILLCEDSRKTGQLLSFYQIENKPKLISFYEQVEQKKIPQILEWLRQGKEVGLVTNSGTPLLSDPGFRLVRECVRQEVQVVPIPGASALLAGLVVSGLPMDKFVFLGFLPKKEGKKRQLLGEIKKMQAIKPMTMVFYESPFRCVKTLQLIAEFFPQAQVVIGRELTKKFEEIIRGKPGELVKRLENKKIKGELIVMFSNF